jgi:hypothetical protein
VQTLHRGYSTVLNTILSLEAGEWNLPGQQKGEEIDDDIGVEDPEGEGSSLTWMWLKMMMLVNGRMMMISNIIMQSFTGTIMDIYYYIFGVIMIYTI